MGKENDSHGKTGRVLKKVMSRHGLDDEQVFIT